MTTTPYIPTQYQASSFSGVSTSVYASLGNSLGVQLNGSVAFTVEFWVQFQSLASGTLLSQQGVYNIGISNGAITVQITNAPLIVSSDPTETPLDTDTWHFVVVTFDTGTMNIYIDGLLSSQTLMSVATPVTSTSPHLAGAGFAGYLGMIQLFNFAKGIDQLDGDPFTISATANPAPVGLFDFTQSPPQDLIHGTALVTQAGVSSVLLTQCLSMDGTGYLRVPAEDPLAPGALGTNSYTIQAWVYLNVPTSVQLSALGGLLPQTQVVLASNDITNAAGVGLAIVYDSTSQMFQPAAIRGAWSGSPALTGSFMTGIPTNAWTNIAVTYDAGSTTLSLYVDGAFAGTSTSSATIPALDSPITTLGAGLGGTGNNYGVISPFEGTLTQVMVWSEALTQTEIISWMNDEPDLSTVGANLTGLFRLTEQDNINAVTNLPVGAVGMVEQQVIAQPVFASHTMDIRGQLSGPPRKTPAAQDPAVVAKVAELRAGMDFGALFASIDPAQLVAARDKELADLRARLVPAGKRQAALKRIEKAWDDAIARLKTDPMAGGGIVQAHMVDDEVWFVWHEAKQSFLIGRQVAASLTSCQTWQITFVATILLNILSLVFAVQISNLLDGLQTWIQSNILNNPAALQAIIALFASGVAPTAMWGTFLVLCTYNLLSSLVWQALSMLSWWALGRLLAWMLSFVVTWQARLVNLIAQLLVAVAQVTLVYNQRPQNC